MLALDGRCPEQQNATPTRSPNVRQTQPTVGDEMRALSRVPSTEYRLLRQRAPLPHISRAMQAGLSGSIEPQRARWKPSTSATVQGNHIDPFNANLGS